MKEPIKEPTMGVQAGDNFAGGVVAVLLALAAIAMGVVSFFYADIQYQLSLASAVTAGLAAVFAALVSLGNHWDALSMQKHAIGRTKSDDLAFWALFLAAGAGIVAAVSLTQYYDNLIHVEPLATFIASLV